MVSTVDGTGLKKARKTATHPRKEVCKLATNFQIYWNTLDKEERDRRASEQKKRIRKQTRNRKARYGRRKAIVMTTNPTRSRRGGLEVTSRSNKP